MTSYLTNMD